MKKTIEELRQKVLNKKNQEIIDHICNKKQKNIEWELFSKRTYKKDYFVK